MLSVIIPIYNTAGYLDRCIQSVLKSSYRDFELILVNDGSSDRSSRICKKYCQEDDRIKYYEQEHTGVSSARNKGIEESSGEWIIFVDSDDFISEDFFNIVMKEEYQSADMLLFDFCRLGGKKESGVGCSRSISCTENNIYLIEHLLDLKPLVKNANISLPSPCTKAYKKSIIDRYGIRFPSDITIGEDRLFNIQYFLRVSSCVYIQRTVYYVEPRPDSSMRGFQPDFLENDIRYQRYLRRILKKQHILSELLTPYYNSVLTNMADILIRSVYHPESARSSQESRSLCNKMQEDPIYRQALKYNSRTGGFPRKLLMFCFKRRYYVLVKLICEMSFWILSRTGGL